MPQKRHWTGSGEACSAFILALLGSDDVSIAGDWLCSTELIQFALFGVKFAVDRFHRAADKMIVHSVFQCFFVNPERFSNTFNSAINVLVGVRETHDQRRHEQTTLDGFLQEQGSEGLRRILVFIARRIDEVRLFTKYCKMTFEMIACDGAVNPLSQTSALGI